MPTRLLLAITLAALIGGGKGVCMLGCSEGSSSQVAATTADPPPCHAAVPPAAADGGDGYGAPQLDVRQGFRMISHAPGRVAEPLDRTRPPVGFATASW